MPNRAELQINDPYMRPKTRRKMDISLRFRLRSGQNTDTAARQLQIRLTVQGVTVSDYASGVTVRPEQWNQRAQTVKGRSAAADNINERLAEIEAEHRTILREVRQRHAKGQGPLPTADLVRAEWLHPGQSQPKLVATFRAWLHHIDELCGTEDAKAEKTLTRAYKTLDHIKAYLQHNRAERLLTAEVTTAWGRSFHAWLQRPRPDAPKKQLGKDTANKHLANLRLALDYAHESGQIAQNPLDKFRPKRGRAKAVYFLEAQHIERLMQLPDYGAGLGVALWWARLMCHTGMDYADAKRYVADPETYHALTPGRRAKIVIERNKPPHVRCEIPMLTETSALMQCVPADTPPTLAELNRQLQLVEQAIGFEFRLSSKILRKSAGAIFLRRNFSIAAVSGILGHTAIRTTERHYVKVTASFMDAQIDQTLNTPTPPTL